MHKKRKIKILRKMRDLLSKPGAWIKRALARDKDGESVHSCSPDACSFCLKGAINRFCPDLDDRTELVRVLEKNIKSPHLTMYEYNDSKHRRQSHVIALLDRTIKKLEQG